jgi:hypothetical protein
MLADKLVEKFKEDRKDDPKFDIICDALITAWAEIDRLNEIIYSLVEKDERPF